MINIATGSRRLIPLALLLAAAPALSQPIQGLPRQSQRQSISQTIGVSEVALVYHRPQTRSRVIWGSLVPYDQVWRAGANENTTISFSDPVRVEGHDLAAGTYGLHMLPGEKEWQVIFSTNSTSWGSFTYDEAEDALRVTVRPQEAPYQEVMTYRFDHVTPDGGIVVLHWDELEIPFEIEFDVHELALAKIRRDLRSLPGFSWMGWHSAANYCLQNNLNHEEALEWIDRALGMEENFAGLSVKAGLLDQVGRTDEALAMSDQLQTHGNEQQINAHGYQLLQRGRTEKAIAAFEQNTRKHPESWNVWDSLGEGLANAGRTQEAITSYSKALEMAPEAQKARITQILEGLRKQ